MVDGASRHEPLQIAETLTKQVSPVVVSTAHAPNFGAASLARPLLNMLVPPQRARRGP